MPSLMPWLRLMRLPAAFSAASNIIASQLIATQGHLQLRMLLLLLGCSICLYLGGMISNDCFDVEEDARDRPSRPIPADLVSLRSAWVAATILFITGLTFAASAGWPQFIIALTLVTLIFLYNGYTKRWWIGPLIMGLCRYTNWILGLSATGLNDNSFYLALPPGLYVMALTMVSREETTAHSRQALLLCGGMMLITASIIAALNGTGLLPHNWALILLGGGAAIVLQRLLDAWRDYTPQKIQNTVTILLIGIIPLDAIMAFAGGPWWGGLIVFALWYPGRLLARLIRIT